MPTCRRSSALEPSLTVGQLTRPVCLSPSHVKSVRCGTCLTILEREFSIEG